RRAGPDRRLVPVVQLRHPRRRHLPDRRDQAAPLRQRRQGDRRRQPPHRRAQVPGQTDRPRAEVHRGHQQLPGERAWQVPSLADGKAVIIESPEENRQVVVEYIRTLGTVNPTADNNWSFAKTGKTVTVMFESSPAAEKLVAGNPKLSVLGPGENGFLRYG